MAGFSGRLWGNIRCLMRIIVMDVTALIHNVLIFVHMDAQQWYERWHAATSERYGIQSHHMDRTQMRLIVAIQVARLK